MSTPIRIIGSYLSPYVRKVLVALAHKGLSYEVDPIIPFFGDDRFTQMSPLRAVPVLVDDRVTISDSSVICQYLEDRYPHAPLYPTDIGDRARARVLEEVADVRLGDVFVWKLFNQVAINRFVWGVKPDPAVLDQTLKEEVPPLLDFLEKALPEAGYLFGTLCIADISVAAFFRNAKFAGFEADAARWPRTRGFVDRLHGLEAFRALMPFEELSLRNPIPRHREALREAGAPITAETVGTATPRRGLFRR